MYFNKYPYRSNFEFIPVGALQAEGPNWTWPVREFETATGTFRKAPIRFDVLTHENDIYSFKAQGPQWMEYHVQSELNLPAPSPKGGFSQMQLDGGLGIVIQDLNGTEILRSVPGQSFGKCGEAHLFQFYKPKNANFYGLGEKMFGLEHSGVTTKFWNADVWADFHHKVFMDQIPDPLYVSVPYLIIKSGKYWVGLLLDNPEATFIRTSNKVNIAGQMEAQGQIEESIILGSEGGQPRLIILVAQSLAELTRKYQTVVGRTPLPPAWALGYQQCRWGYESMHDLHYLDAGMNKYEIPCDGLWLDIEYMRGYRVFTFEEKNFPKVEENLAEMQTLKRRIVPIIDPGVKAEAGYGVYDSGKAGDHFCKNPQGHDFIGLVWPGETVFPDFSLPQARSWWAEQVEDFAHQGITAAWLDMNDPATGDSLNELMRFDHGRLEHRTFHNQYALGMAKATRSGFEAARPEERVFLLSRSGFTGISKYSAIWTGDNVSNYHYLKKSIPCSINLALSGIPFNGPDVGGFGDRCYPQLMKDWVKAGFLFPFFRNHCIRNDYLQEPWAFDGSTLEVFRHYVRLRYKLRPYLMQLFMAQETCGEAILRPIFYNYPDEQVFDFSRTENQFMVGSAILQAPFVEENQTQREVLLPSDLWYDVEHQTWRQGGQKLMVQKSDSATPLYFRQGEILPIARNQGGDHGHHAREIDFHVILKANAVASAAIEFSFDDGLSKNYQKGERSCYALDARVEGKTLHLSSRYLSQGYGQCDVRFVTYDHFESVILDGQKLHLQKDTFTWMAHHKIDPQNLKLWK